MGMFDDLRCKYPLPVDGANEVEYQTKSFDCPRLDNYEIREDGSLWHEEYDTEDRSDPNAKGLDRIIGMLTPINKRWVRFDLTGEVQFYGSGKKSGRLEWSAYFVDGQLKELHLIERREP